jgi:hypothetical protein
MSKLQKHDGDFVDVLYGLGNNGSLCYLNALTQALSSCPAFIKELKKSETDLKAKPGLGGALLSLMNSRLSTSEAMLTVGNIAVYKKIKVDSTVPIFDAIQKARANKKATLIRGQQEDPFEGFKFIMEELGEPFLQLFYTRYKLRLNCTKCGSKLDAEVKSCPPEIMLNMSESDPLLQGGLETQEEVEDFIRLHMLYPDDYKCEKCGAKNNLKADPPQCPVQQYYALGRVSSIIVMSFHDNMQIMFNNANKGEHGARVARFFPNELRIKTKTGTLVYRVVAQIEHTGNLSGGHYIAKCLRPRPHGFADQRIESAKKALTDTMERLKASQDPARIEILERKRDAAQRAINEEQEIASISSSSDNLDLFIKKYYATWKFNDKDVSYDPKGFVPSPNTYLVFYHLFQEIAS